MLQLLIFVGPRTALVSVLFLLVILAMALTYHFFPQAGLTPGVIGIGLELLLTVVFVRVWRTEVEQSRGLIYRTRSSPKNGNVAKARNPRTKGGRRQR